MIMMEVYKIILDDAFDWDEYDSCVVVANTKAEARSTAEAKCFNFKDKELIITEIGSSYISEPKVICASFNAG